MPISIPNDAWFWGIDHSSPCANLLNIHQIWLFRFGAWVIALRRFREALIYWPFAYFKKKKKESNKSRPSFLWAGRSLLLGDLLPLVEAEAEQGGRGAHPFGGCLGERMCTHGMRLENLLTSPPSKSMLKCGVCISTYRKGRRGNCSVMHVRGKLRASVLHLAFLSPWCHCHPHLASLRCWTWPCFLRTTDKTWSIFFFILNKFSNGAKGCWLWITSRSTDDAFREFCWSNKQILFFS